MSSEKHAIGDNWTRPTFVIRSIGPKLFPFFKTVAIYLVLADRESPSWFTCLLKCLPIIWLCVFVVLQGISLGDKHWYSRRILTGLVLSCLGDAFLVWPKFFLWGMLAFGAAHIAYVSAFGFRPLKVKAGLVCALLAVIMQCIMYPSLKGIFSIAVPIYNLVLITMVWRAVARVYISGELWTWTSLCSCIGSILFAISDGILGFREFGLITEMISSSQCQLLVMLTYYGAQVGIALSVVDSKAILSAQTDAKRDQRKHKTK